MTIIEVHASAQAGFNHPSEQYANFKPSISLRALVESSEDPEVAAADLLKRAQAIVDGERARIEAECKRKTEINIATREVLTAENHVSHYERVIAEFPAFITDASKMATLTEWEREEKIDSLQEARDNISEARENLMNARRRLGHLLPEAIPVVVTTPEGVITDRTTLGVITKNQRIKTAEAVEHVMSKHGFGLLTPDGKSIRVHAEYMMTN